MSCLCKQLESYKPIADRRGYAVIKNKENTALLTLKGSWKVESLAIDEKQKKLRRNQQEIEGNFPSALVTKIF